MKNLFLLAFLLMSFTSISFASNSNLILSSDITAEDDILIVAKISWYGKYEGSTFETIYNEDGSTTTTIDFDCDPESNLVCYSVETKPAGLTEISPTGGQSVQGILIESNENEHWYKLKSYQSNQ